METRRAIDGDLNASAETAVGPWMFFSDIGISTPLIFKNNNSHG